MPGIRQLRALGGANVGAAHVVEMTLSYLIAEAEQVYGKRWDEELDRHLQMGMFAMDRISADGTMGKAVAAEPSVCRRTARIGNCEDVAPMSHYWGRRTINPDGTYRRPEPYSCVPGTPPIDHSTLIAHDETNVNRGIGRDAAGYAGNTEGG